MNIREQVPLAPFTTIKIGGPARFFAEASSADDIRQALDFARPKNLPVFVLGGGSNILVADSGFPGLVIRIASSGISRKGDVFDVAAGEDWDTFVAYAVGQDCAGLECLSGIPGTVGGTPVQNVGAYGQEVAETITRVAALDVETGRECEFSNEECRFAYRTSRFNTVDRGRYIVLRVSFALRPGGEPKLAYGDLKTRFAEGKTPSLAEVRETVLQVRRGKGMVIDDSDADSRSAGSFFKNPVLTKEQFKELERLATERGLMIPSYPALSSQKKVSAAWLIENAGFPKGYSRGAAGISTKHTLAVVNRGWATAAEIVALKAEIQRGVLQQFGIELQPEPVFLGFDEGRAK